MAMVMTMIMTCLLLLGISPPKTLFKLEDFFILSLGKLNSNDFSEYIDNKF